MLFSILNFCILIWKWGWDLLQICISTTKRSYNSIKSILLTEMSKFLSNRVLQQQQLTNSYTKDESLKGLNFFLQLLCILFPLYFWNQVSSKPINFAAVFCIPLMRVTSMISFELFWSASFQNDLIGRNLLPPELASLVIFLCILLWQMIQFHLQSRSPSCEFPLYYWTEFEFADCYLPENFNLRIATRQYWLNSSGILANNTSQGVEQTAPELFASIAVDDEVNRTVDNGAESSDKIGINMPGSNVVDSLFFKTIDDSRNSTIANHWWCVGN